MSARAKLIFGTAMVIALLFGFLHTLWPEAVISMKRLHIFLFNLLTGGSLILYFIEGRGAFSLRVKLFGMVAVIYALGAAARIYPVTLIASIPLFLLVESARIRTFSFLPLDFFKGDVPIDRKFRHAATLCLSCGIVIASFVILNNEYFEWVYYEKLTLDVFFLGYSFPISLITMSLMFSFMSEKTTRLVRVLKEACFWLVNLGVVTFFAFIIFELFIPEMVVSITLFVTVCIIFVLFTRDAPSLQQKTFLVSGMVFLLSTAITGIFYIMLYFFPALEPYRELILVFHSTVSLYGWNLSGLFIIIRWDDFPIKLPAFAAILLHWIIVLFLVPWGKFVPVVAVVAMPAYVVLLGLVFVSRGKSKMVNS